MVVVEQEEGFVDFPTNVKASLRDALDVRMANATLKRLILFVSVYGFRRKRGSK